MTLTCILELCYIKALHSLSQTNTFSQWVPNDEQEWQKCLLKYCLHSCCALSAMKSTYTALLPICTAIKHLLVSVETIRHQVVFRIWNNAFSCLPLKSILLKLGFSVENSQINVISVLCNDWCHISSSHRGKK